MSYDPSRYYPILGPDGEPIERPQSEWAVPHVHSFASLLQTSSRVYWQGMWDEAMRHSRHAALVMRNDCGLMGLMQERKLAVASLKWHLEVEDEHDPRQVFVRDHLTKGLRHTKGLAKVIMSLLEAIWYGRAGVQVQWHYQMVRGVKTLCLRRWLPVNGDKIGYTWDHRPYLLLSHQQAYELDDADIVQTSQGANGVVLRGSWNDRFLIHSHEPEDADFFDVSAADAVHGVGVRSRVFWIDWIDREWLSWISDFLQRFGLGVTFWYYDASNPQSKIKAQEAANNQSNRTNLLVPRWGNANVPAVERMDTPATGTEVLIRLRQTLYQMKERYIVGQSMSASASGGSGGLGNEAAAEFQWDTKRQIRNFDANNLAETLTGDDDESGLVSLMQRWTFPETYPSEANPRGFPVRWVFELEQHESAAKMAAATTLIQLGLPVKADDLYAASGLSKPAEGDDLIGGAPPEQPEPPGRDDDEYDSYEDEGDPDDDAWEGYDREDGRRGARHQDTGEEIFGDQPDDEDDDQGSARYSRIGNPLRYAPTVRGQEPERTVAPNEQIPPVSAPRYGTGIGDPVGTKRILPPPPAHEPKDITPKWEAYQTKSGELAFRHNTTGKIHRGANEPRVSAEEVHRKHWEPRNAPPRTQYLPESSERIKDTLGRLFPGGSVTMDQLHKLTGAAPGMTINVYSGMNPHAPKLHLEGQGHQLSKALGMDRTLSRDNQGHLVMNHNALGLKKAFRKGGLGSQIFTDAAKALAEAGVHRIDTVAGKGKDMTGYKVWPLMGYDAPLSEWQRITLPAHLRGARTVQDLYAQPGGREHWEKNGDTTPMSFDLTPGSRSWQVLNARRQAKGLPAIELSAEDIAATRQRHLQHHGHAQWADHARLMGYDPERVHAAAAVHMAEGRPLDWSYRQAILDLHAARQEKPALAFARTGEPDRHARTEKGRWITLGGVKGEDGKRHGGSPVYVVDGRITKGAPSLTGKRIDALKEEGDDDPATHRQQMNREKQYQRSVWAKKARQQGVNPEELHQLAGDFLAHDKELKGGLTAMLKHARQMLAKGGYNAGALAMNVGSGRVEDAASVKGLDEVGASMAAQYPEHFAGYRDPVERLFDLLGVGNPEAMAEDDAYEQAFEHLLDRSRSQADQRGDEFGSIPVGELRRVDGFAVRRTGDNTYRIEKESGIGHVTGDPEKIRAYIDRELQGQRAYGRQLPEALARADAFAEPSFMDPEGMERAARGFAALPQGTTVVSLDEDAGTKGRVGRIVKDDAGRNRVRLDGEDGFGSNHIEPLDPDLSWRVERSESDEDQGPAQSDLFDNDAVPFERPGRPSLYQRVLGHVGGLLRTLAGR